MFKKKNRAVPNSFSVCIVNGRAYVPTIRFCGDVGVMISDDPVFTTTLDAMALKKAIEQAQALSTAGHAQFHVSEITKKESLLKASGIHTWREFHRQGWGYTVSSNIECVVIEATRYENGAWLFAQDLRKTLPIEVTLDEIVALILSDTQLRMTALPSHKACVM